MNELDRYAVSLENMEVLREQVEVLEAWKAEELALMNPLMDYARSVCTGPLGCSLTDWLVEDHQKQAREIERLKRDNNRWQGLAKHSATELAAMKAQPSGVDSVDRITIALEAVQSAMEDAYSNAYQDCCGRGNGECCGNPVAAWSDSDQAIMDALSPAQRELSALLASAALSASHGEQVREGWKLVPVKPSIDMVEAGYEASLGCPDRGSYARVIEQYDAMLAATPSPGSQEQGE